MIFTRWAGGSPGGRRPRTSAACAAAPRRLRRRRLGDPCLGGLEGRHPQIPWHSGELDRIEGTCAPDAPSAGTVGRLLDPYASATAPFLHGCYALPVGVAVFVISALARAAVGRWIAGTSWSTVSTVWPTSNPASVRMRGSRAPGAPHLYGCVVPESRERRICTDVWFRRPGNSGRRAAPYAGSEQRDHVALARLDERAIQPAAEVAYQQWIGQGEPAQTEQAQQQLLLLRHVHLQLSGDRLKRRAEQAQMSPRPSRHTRSAQRLALNQRQEVRPFIQKLQEVLDHDLERTVGVVGRCRSDTLACLLDEGLGAVEHPLKDCPVKRLLGTEEVARRAAREPGGVADALHADCLEAQVGEQGFGSVQDRLAAAFGSTSVPRVVQGLANQPAPYSITFARRPGGGGVGLGGAGRGPMSAGAAELGPDGRGTAPAARASGRQNHGAHLRAPRLPSAAGDSRRPKRRQGRQEQPARPRPLSSG